MKIFLKGSVYLIMSQLLLNIFKKSLEFRKSAYLTGIFMLVMAPLKSSMKMTPFFMYLFIDMMMVASTLEIIKLALNYLAKVRATDITTCLGLTPQRIKLVT